MDERSTERAHHDNLRKLRWELSLAPVGIKRAKLLTLIARANMEAADYGWGKTVD
jgi:hypothetical protein